MKHILVNKKVITVPGYQSIAGDVISMSPEKKTGKKMAIWQQNTCALPKTAVVVGALMMDLAAV